MAVHPSLLGSWVLNFMFEARVSWSLFLKCANVATRIALCHSHALGLLFFLNCILITIILDLHIHCNLPLVMKYLLTCRSSFTMERLSSLSLNWKILGWNHWRNWKSPQKFSPPKVGTLSRFDPSNVYLPYWQKRHYITSVQSLKASCTLV